MNQLTWAVGDRQIEMLLALLGNKEMESKWTKLFNQLWLFHSCQTIKQVSALVDENVSAVHNQLTWSPCAGCGGIYIVLIQ